MELQVIIKEQFPVKEREYTKNGETRKFASKGFVLSDGMNEFYAEMTGDKARNCEPLDVMTAYVVQIEMHYRSYFTQTGDEAHTTDIYINRMKKYGV